MNPFDDMLEECVPHQTPIALTLNDESIIGGKYVKHNNEGVTIQTQNGNETISASRIELISIN